MVLELAEKAALINADRKLKALGLDDVFVVAPDAQVDRRNFDADVEQ